MGRGERKVIIRDSYTWLSNYKCSHTLHSTEGGGSSDPVQGHKCMAHTLNDYSSTNECLHPTALQLPLNLGLGQIYPASTPSIKLLYRFVSLLTHTSLVLGKERACGAERSLIIPPTGEPLLTRSVVIVMGTDTEAGFLSPVVPWCLVYSLKFVGPWQPLLGAPSPQVPVRLCLPGSHWP